jgi:hypothetical protein
MEIQYFYRDPLAATWMAKHFGMRFCQNGLGQDLIGMELGDPYEPSASVVCTPEELATAAYEQSIFKGIIQPESLNLLKPRVGDIVRYRVKDCTYIGEAPLAVSTLTYRKRPLSGVNQPEYHPRLEWIDRVIQRDGIPFMWPEAEPTNKQTDADAIRHVK